MENPITNALEKRDVRLLCKVFFNATLTEGQIEIVRAVAFDEYPKLSICAMTRYGKSYCVALGIGLYILLNEKKKISFIAPTKEQAGILRDYMAELISSSTYLAKIAHLEIFAKEGQSKADRLKQEASKNRVTFKNGCEYRIFTAANDGRALMGFGVGREGGKIIKDEATKLTVAASTKISRMIGDNPENTQEIELFNPWDRDNRAFEHYCNNDWHKIHIGWEQALEEGRTTKLFIDQQRKELTPIEFTVLYDSEFPDQPSDAIFNIKWLDTAEKKKSQLDVFMQDINVVRTPMDHNENALRKAKERLKGFKFIISCDVADKGLDQTVIFDGFKRENYYEILNSYHEPQSENIEIGKKLVRIAEKYVDYKLPVEINIDGHGIGVGVISYVKDIVRARGWSNVNVKSCLFGGKAMKNERFTNKKAENYFRLRALLEDGLIAIKPIPRLKSELMAMKWDKSSSEKIKIIDPEEKSPDFADSLVYFIWKDSEDFIIDFA